MEVNIDNFFLESQSCIQEPHRSVKSTRQAILLIRLSQVFTSFNLARST